MRSLCFFLIAMMLTSPVFSQGFQGAGATFPTLLFEKMFAKYQKETGQTVVYKSIGSGNGIEALKQGTIDFAVSDIHLCCELNDDDVFVSVPVTIGAVSLIYNLPGVPILKLSPTLISDIFQGKIDTWNHPRIRLENQRVTLPDLPIVLVLRSDKSGTTSLLTSYLSRVSPAWSSTIGLSAQFTVSGARYVDNNAEMADLIMQTPGSFGYTEWHYARAKGASIAAIRNTAGHYLQPSIDAIADAMKTEQGAYAYPITGYSYLLLYRDQNRLSTLERARSLVDLVWWMTHEGQMYAESLGFPPLSLETMKESSQLLRDIHFDGVLLR